MVNFILQIIHENIISSKNAANVLMALNFTYKHSVLHKRFLNIAIKGYFTLGAIIRQC